MTRKQPAVAGEPTTMGKLRWFVIQRDGICLAFSFSLLHPDSVLGKHQCSDGWSRQHRPTDLPMLTLEHVPKVHRISDLRRDDEAHCVTLCHKVNFGGPPQVLRDWLRTYLRTRYPDCTKERR